MATMRCCSAYFFCFNQGDGDVRLVVENVVSKLGLAAGDQLATDNDSAIREVDFLTYLKIDVPPCLLNGGCDKFGANIPFGEGLLVDGGHRGVR